MNPRLKELLPAIVSRVIERGSFVSKTKLLKLLYLFDVEWYRSNRSTYTGFDWIFYKLGPWTREYDPLLDAFFANAYLEKQKGRDAYDTEFITTKDKIYLNRLFDTREQERVLEDLVRTWATVPTPQILDHAYFRTEPMRNAIRGERLDFSTVSETPPALYTRASSGRSPEQIEVLRRMIAERLAQTHPEPQAGVFTPPKYDEEFFNAMDQLESMK